MAADDERSKWTDFALDQRAEHVDTILEGISKMPDTVARMAVAQENMHADVSELRVEIRDARAEGTEEHKAMRAEYTLAREDIRGDFRRVWEKLDAIRTEQGDRDREYRRNVVIALGPLGLAALGIIAKLAGVA